MYREVLLNSFLNPVDEARKFNADAETTERFKLLADQTLAYTLQNPIATIEATGRYLDTMVRISSYIIRDEDVNGPRATCQKCSETSDAFKMLEKSVFTDMVVRTKHATCMLWEQFASEMPDEEINASTGPAASLYGMRRGVCNQTDDFAIEKGWFGMFASQLMAKYKSS